MLVQIALDDYCEMLDNSAGQAGEAVLQMLDRRFGHNGGWKRTLGGNGELVRNEIVNGIVVGSEDVLSALSQPNAAD